MIEATPQVLERVYFAIKRCKAKPNATAKDINAEVTKKFGTALSTAHWTVLNAARRDDALDRIVTRSFDFRRHGKKSRQGKSAAGGRKPASPEAERRGKGGRRRSDSIEKLKLDPKKHPRYLLSTWVAGRRSFIECRTRKDVDREVKKLIRAGVALADMSVYTAEGLSFKLKL